MSVAVSEFPFDQAFRGTVDAAGELVVAWDSGGIVNWNVQQVSVEMPNAPVGAACFLRKQGKLVSNMIATGDTAAGDPSVYLKPGETMTVEWTGCTPGDVGVVFVIYQKVGFRR
jgi:hypothetical protein